MNIWLAGFVIITAGIVKNVSAEFSKSDVQEIRIIIIEELIPIEERISSVDKCIDSLEKRIEDLRAFTLNNLQYDPSIVKILFGGGYHA